MVKTTKVQDKVLRLLKRRWRERGSQPNLNEVAGELGMQYMSLKGHLEALEEEGVSVVHVAGPGQAAGHQAGARKERAARARGRAPVG